MGEFEIGRVIYLVVLLVAVGSWVFVQNRQSIGKTLQMFAVWGFIFLGVIASYGLWEDIRQTVRPQQSVAVEAGRVEVPRAPDGHYYLTLEVNGAAVPFLVDTGASEVVLNARDAERAGIDTGSLAYLGRARTANGEVRTASVWIEEMSLGGITDTDVRVWVNQGELEQSLLGMGYLQRWSSIEIRNGALVLTR
ncbi:TIGR02281 family clan AA aspartic protease [Leisingera sp. M527]|uniref:retropepsin-like aspartic protease family protein n=2 Tax=Leisingera TaxID=191028 RepID=UPI001011FBD0|nr:MULTISPECIES: TIGR02281 family clan AA aspartic protease [unclassified Leisingera]MBQ4827080.1 TIGR02281 family clan AA aspartic protease [Leisingera sp. HS039]MCF6429729.1 TIGR02281 family clan AA aspartic protease [Leisingera sp. MMG026]QAX29927.1 TIGR02281 family clan AA aspartic protease [Leisingera sp. NJS204]QBR36660.1 TIGR02281 family clan AA aspartic protease [Leisingera sp. NJS201]UWQ30181.1 TIGR02281 family clan AA aspartic protease [Leisingera sp. M523]